METPKVIVYKKAIRHDKPEISIVDKSDPQIGEQMQFSDKSVQEYMGEGVWKPVTDGGRSPLSRYVFQIDLATNQAVMYYVKGEMIYPTSIYDMPANQLTTLVIGDDVTRIGEEAALGANEYRGLLQIPNSVTSIGKKAFYNNRMSGALIIPDSVVTIEEQAFLGAVNFTDLVVGNGVTNIGAHAFRNCKFKTIILGDSITHLANACLYDNRLVTEIILPNSLTTAEGSIVRACAELTHLTIPESLTTIGPNAFAQNPKLANVKCYTSKTAIDSSSDIFQYCNSLNEIHVRSDDNTWTAGDSINLPGRTLKVIKDL